MVQVSGKIQYVNQPEGRRPGSIKVDGKYIAVPTPMLAQFKQGDTVNLEAKSREYQGRTYYDLDHIVQAPTPNMLGQMAQSLPQGAYLDRPKPNGMAKNDSKDSRMMFIMGVVGRSMQSGKFNGADMIMLTETAMKCYERTQAPAHVVHEEFNDDISHVGRAGDPRDEIPY